MTKTRTPAVEGWFTTDPREPHLIGARCPKCESVVFPPREGACPNPECGSDTLVQTELSRRGHVYQQFPMLTEEIAHAVRARSCVLDGEIVCLAPDGRSLFQRLCEDRHQR